MGTPITQTPEFKVALLEDLKDKIMLDPEKQEIIRKIFQDPHSDKVMRLIAKIGETDVELVNAICKILREEYHVAV